MASRLSGPQKAAILLLSLGEEAASEVMKNLNESEIKDVSQYMTRFQHVTPSDVDRVVNEFYLVAQKGRFLPAPPVTKVEYLKKILAPAIGEVNLGILQPARRARAGADSTWWDARAMGEVDDS